MMELLNEHALQAEEILIGESKIAISNDKINKAQALPFNRQN